PSGGTAATASSLAAGNYTCTITDANNCTTTQAVAITQPAAGLSTSISSQTNVNCFGNGTGAATINVSGGTAGYSYSWSPSGGTAATASSLAAGSYTCTVTDSKSCTKTQAVTITQPVATISATLTPTNINCAVNGSVTTNPAGGTPA